jgi:hypothetical protein
MNREQILDLYRKVARRTYNNHQVMSPDDNWVIVLFAQELLKAQRKDSDARIETLRKALFTARDVMSVMADKVPEYTGYLRAQVLEANNALHHTPKSLCSTSKVTEVSPDGVAVLRKEFEANLMKDKEEIPLSTLYLRDQVAKEMKGIYKAFRIKSRKKKHATRS